MTDTTLIYHQLDLSDSYLVNVHLLLKSYGQMFQMLNYTEHVYCLQQPFYALHLNNNVIQWSIETWERTDRPANRETNRQPERILVLYR